MKTLKILIICIAAPFFVKAQPENLSTYLNMSLEELMNINVISPTLTGELYLKSSSTIIVITEQMIKERGYHHLEEVLHDLPGFDFNKAFGDEYSTVFMRGLRTSNTDGFIFLYDGINQNDIWKKSIWVSRQFPVTNIKRIEIMYGPSSALWGTHAFSGIVNVITKSPEEMGTNITISGGSYETKNFEFNTGNKINNEISYSLSIKYFDAAMLHPWEFAKLKYPDNFSPTYRDSLNKPIAFLDGKLNDFDMDDEQPSTDYGIHANVFIGKNLKLSMLSCVKDETDGYWFNPMLGRGRYTEWRTAQQGGVLEHTMNPSDKITMKSILTYRIHKLLPSRNIKQFFYSDIDSNDLYNTSSIKHNDVTTYLLKYDSIYGFGVVNYSSLSAWDMSFQEQLSYMVFDKMKMSGDASYSYTNTQEDYNKGLTPQSLVMSPRRNRKKLNMALQLDYKPFNNLSTVIGARYEQTENDFSKGYRILVPRVSLVYNKKNIVVRLQYAEAFREASDFQLFSTSSTRPYSSPELMPEQSKCIETGVSYNFRNKLFLSLAVYYSIQENLIINNPALDLDNPISGTPAFINDNSKSKIYGYELYSVLELSKAFSLQACISGAFNYSDLQKVDAFNNLVFDVYGNPIIEKNVLYGDMAPVRANLLFAYNWKNKVSVVPRLNYATGIKTINHRLNPDIDPIETFIKGYAVLGLNVTIFNLVNYLDFNVKIDNMLNEKYYNPGVRAADGVLFNAEVLQPGINFMVGLNYRFE